MRQPGSNRRQTGARDRRAVNRKDASRSKPGRQEPRVSTTMRLRQSLRRDLEAAAARSRRSVADVAQELLEEALRMRQCPGIYFADEPTGRTAKIGGTGLAVWEVLRDFNRDKDAKRLAAMFPQLSQAQLTAALMYYRRYSEEVQSKVDANKALTPERLEREYPGLVRVVSVR